MDKIHVRLDNDFGISTIDTSYYYWSNTGMTHYLMPIIFFMLFYLLIRIIYTSIIFSIISLIVIVVSFLLFLLLNDLNEKWYKRIYTFRELNLTKKKVDMLLESWSGHIIAKEIEGDKYHIELDNDITMIILIKANKHLIIKVNSYNTLFLKQIDSTFDIVDKSISTKHINYFLLTYCIYPILILLLLSIVVMSVTNQLLVVLLGVSFITSIIFLLYLIIILPKYYLEYKDGIVSFTRIRIPTPDRYLLFIMNSNRKEPNEIKFAKDNILSYTIKNNIINIIFHDGTNLLLRNYLDWGKHNYQIMRSLLDSWRQVDDSVNPVTGQNGD